MTKKPLKARLTKALLFVAALGSGLALGGVNLASAAPITYCGDFSYDGGWGTQTATATYNSSTSQCEISFVNNGNFGPSASSIALPGHLTSVDIVAVGGGGSGNWETTNWADFYFSSGNTNNISAADSGGGGGGGAVWEASGFSVNRNYRFSAAAGTGGRLTDYGSPFGGAMGVDGTSSTLSVNNGTTTTTLTAGGGLAPSNTNWSQGGSGGSASPASFSGFNRYNGTSGLGTNTNNTSPYGGVWVYGLGNLGEGGGSSSYSSNTAGTPGSAYGSGGGGGMVNDGAWAPNDLSCYIYGGEMCNGKDGIVRFSWAAVNYIPVYLQSQPSLDSSNPVVGQVLTANNTLNIGVDVTPAPTITYQWYRCSGSTPYAWEGNVQATGCTAISGATSATYTLVSADLGYYIQPKITLVNSGTGSTTTLVAYTESTQDRVVTTPSAPTISSATPYSKTPSSAKIAFVAANFNNWNAGYTAFSAVRTADDVAVGTLTWDGSAYLNLTGLTPNTAYSLKVKVTNAAGTSAGSATTLSFTTPLAVTNSETPQISSTDIRVGKALSYTPVTTWSANSTPTVTKTWYYCTASKTAAYQSEGTNTALISGCTSAGTATSLTLNSAHLGKYIVVLETATDSFSTSYHRSASTVMVTGESDAPVLNSVTISYHYRATFYYSAPTFLGSGAQQYNRLQRSSDGGVTWVTEAEISSSSLNVMGNSFTGGLTYLVRVAIKNSSGTYSAWSNSISVTMPRAISVTTYPTLSGGGTIGNSLTLGTGTYASDGTQTAGNTAWYACSTPLTASSGTSAISGLSAAGCVSQTVSTNLTTFTPTYSGLNTKYYVFAAQQMLDSYASNIWARTATVQMLIPPDAPTAVVGTPTSQTAMSVSFTTPAMPGASAITGYKYSVAPGPSYSAWTTPAWTLAGTATTFNITTGLTAGTSYKLRIYAANSYATSAASADSAAIAMPSAPAIAGLPTISGTVAIGSTLTGSTSAATVTGDPTPSVTTEWYSCANTTDAATLTGSCAAITGATSSTYTIGGEQSSKYLVFRMTATNTYGSASAFSLASAQVPGVPGAVTGVSVTVLSTTSVQVDYTMPAQTGAGPVTQIKFQYGVPPYNNWTTLFLAPDLSGSFTVTGLTASTTYKVNIVALNSVGMGPAAESAAFTTFGAPSVTAAPSLAGTAAVGQTLTATEPVGMLTGNPAPAIDSRAWYRCPTTRAAGDSVADCTAISGATATTYSVASADTSSYLVFAANGSNSQGSAQARSASTAIIANVPTAPSATLLSLNGSGSVSVTLTPGLANNSAITGYEYELNGSGNWVSTGSTATTFTVGSLTNGTQYALRIRAINSVGTSSASSAANVTPLAAPTSGAATRGDSQLALSWAATPGATGYTVSYSTSSGSGYVAATGSCSTPSTTSCTLTGLTNGTGYYFKVFANNAAGTSPSSAAFGPFTPLSQDTTLSALVLRGKLTAGSTAIGAALSPAFVSGTRAYTADVSSGTQFVTITATRAITGQVIKVNGTTVTSGSASADIAIAYGANSITIEVQSVERVTDNTSTATANYTIAVTRANPDMSSFTQFATTENSASPVPANFTQIGVTGVTSQNINAIDSAIAALPASAVDTPAELQIVVNAYVSVLSQANGGTPSTPPSAAQYTALGITEVQTFTTAQVTYLNSVVSALAPEVAGNIASLQVAATSITNLYAVAAGGSLSSLSVAQLAAIGVTGVTEANLAAIVAAIAATADDGSGINTIAKVQALVDAAKASNITAIVSATTGGSNSPAPTATNFASAGVTGVSDANASAIAAVLATLPSTSKDSTTELQTVVNAYLLIQAQAANVNVSSVQSVVTALGAATVSAGPTAANYAAIGATTAAALNTAGIELLNSLLGVKQSSAIDSAAEINAIAAAVSVVQTSANSATVSDFELIGIKGVTSANLATIKALVASAPTGAKDSLVELQQLIDSAIIAAAATSFANAAATPGPQINPVLPPSVQDYLSIGVTGVSGSNVVALNTAIAAAAAAANPAGSWVATPQAIQAIVSTLSSAPLAAISAYSGSGSAPTSAQYLAAGVVGVQAANVEAVNSYVASLAATATDSPAELQTVVNAYNAVVSAALANTGSHLTLPQLQALGLTGVTSANLPAIAAAIAL
ncbi:MAG: hypothetical protein RL102_1121, partial [Actinomycetota bacterium]